MNAPRLCPNCRAAVPLDAPAGVCPACALRAALASAPSGPGERRRAELEPDELARLLPELEGFHVLGRGGMGTVYAARHRKLDRAVAVKVLAPDLREEPAFAERFTREARALARLAHPSIVAVHDFGSREGLHYLVMELVEGVSLRQVIEAGELRPREALALVPRICEALQYAHDRGVVHRDIKPENILLARDGTPKIADFGLARLAGEPGAARLTRTEQVMGTWHYMAPEQLERPAEVDHRADIYALGVVLYELLTGELPVGRFAPPSHTVAVASLGQEGRRLDEVVLRTLEREPGRRYQQASELKTDVEALVDAPAREPVVAGRDDAPRAFEHKSERELFGLPLLHVAFSRDPTGRERRVATGIVAVGDVAVGALAIGPFAFGGITLGGISVGLVGFGGVAVGLAVALGGTAIGGLSAGGCALALVSARGAFEASLMELSDAARATATVLAWGIASLAATLLGAVGVWAWTRVAAVREVARRAGA